MRKQPKSTAKRGGLPAWLKYGGAAFALLWVGILFFLALLFSPWKELAPRPLSSRDIQLQFKLISQISRELSNSKGRIPEESRLRLTPEDIDSLVRIADGVLSLRGGDGKKLPPPRYYQIRSRARAVEFVFPVDTGMRWLFGGVIYLRGVVEPEKDGSDLFVTFRSLKAGAWPIPSLIGDMVAKEKLKEIQAQEEFRRFDRMVKSIYFEPGSDHLIVVYRPAALAAGMF